MPPALTFTWGFGVKSVPELIDILLRRELPAPPVARQGDGYLGHDGLPHWSVLAEYLGEYRHAEAALPTIFLDWPPGRPMRYR